jgi:hypothetical protein
MRYLIGILILFPPGCTDTSSEYFPLGEKIIWEYRIQKQLNDELSVGKSIIAQLKSTEVNGIEYFPHKNANGETYYYHENGTGILLSANPEQEGEMILKYPLKPGSRWGKRSRIMVLDSRHESFSGGEAFISLNEDIVLDTRIVNLNDIIEVPAGVFKNCMLLESTASVTVKERTRGIKRIIFEQKEWYAPGVGMVKKMRKEYSVPEKYHGVQITELLRLERD